MIKAIINGKKEFLVDGRQLNGIPAALDVIEVRQNTFHVLSGSKSYNATVLNFSAEEKTMTLSINGSEYEIQIKDKYDLLMQQLGINSGATSAVQHIKAPMPGLIIHIGTAEGAEVKKGDSLLILEAMKMENVIKSPRDGRVKRINVALRQAVEKNQMLLEFE